MKIIKFYYQIVVVFSLLILKNIQAKLCPEGLNFQPLFPKSVSSFGFLDFQITVKKIYEILGERVLLTMKSVVKLPGLKNKFLLKNICQWKKYVKLYFRIETQEYVNIVGFHRV